MSYEVRIKQSGQCYVAYVPPKGSAEDEVTGVAWYVLVSLGVEFYTSARLAYVSA
jgi:hypothetical protein